MNPRTAQRRQREHLHTAQDLFLERGPHHFDNDGNYHNGCGHEISSYDGDCAVPPHAYGASSPCVGCCDDDGIVDPSRPQKKKRLTDKLFDDGVVLSGGGEESHR